MTQEQKIIRAEPGLLELTNARRPVGRMVDVIQHKIIFCAQPAGVGVIGAGNSSCVQPISL